MLLTASFTLFSQCYLVSAFSTRLNIRERNYPAKQPNRCRLDLVEMDEETCKGTARIPPPAPVMAIIKPIANPSTIITVIPKAPPINPANLSISCQPLHPANLSILPTPPCQTHPNLQIDPGCAQAVHAKAQSAALIACLRSEFWRLVTVLS